ncbi:MAG: Maf family protein [Solirubrobacterales bacterium]
MVILASKSPQRKAILEQLGIEFEIVASGVDEIESGDPGSVVVENALLKARDIASRRPAGDIVIGADTVIAHDGDVIGKPVDRDDATRVMRRLAGTDHQVLGGIAAIGPDSVERSVSVATDVSFRDLTDREIDLYVETGEWRERSGGYAIQQRGATLVRAINGDYLNIVGLSVVELLKLVPELHR